jgi:hypothetical protein
LVSALKLSSDPVRRQPGGARREELGMTQRLLQQPVRGIRRWTQELLQQLVAEGKLASDDIKTTMVQTSLAHDVSVLPPEKRPKVATALSNYLALSGEYSYTLDLRRENFKMDPTEDFLRNVKEGHCERFATGLALMLRSAGVPCRLVQGYRGAETRDGTSLGDGWYVVRHSHAHAWVEALVGGIEVQKLHWLTLDPSPPVALDDESRRFSLSLWQQISWHWFRSLWRTFVLEYNTDQQRDSVQTLWNRLRPLRRFGIYQGPFYLAAGAALFVGLIWFRRVKTRRKRSPPRLPAEFDFYGRLQAVLARHCRLTLQPGQTPQEFAVAARQLLNSAASSIALADIPGQVIRLYYRARYGRLPLDPGERQAINQQIDHLAAALRVYRTEFI